MSTLVQNRHSFSGRFYFYFLAIAGFLILQPLLVKMGHSAPHILLINQSLSLLVVGRRGFDLSKTFEKQVQISWFWYILGLGFFGLLCVSLIAQNLFLPSFAFYVIAAVLLSTEICFDYAQSVQETTVELRREMKRISWPSHQETLRFVGIVSVFVLCSAVFWWLLDGMITRVLSFIIHTLSSF